VFSTLEVGVIKGIQLGENPLVKSHWLLQHPRFGGEKGLPRYTSKQPIQKERRLQCMRSLPIHKAGLVYRGFTVTHSKNTP